MMLAAFIFLLALGASLAWAGTRSRHRLLQAGGAVVILLAIMMRYDPLVYSHFGIIALIVPCLFLGFVYHYLTSAGPPSAKSYPEQGAPEIPGIAVTPESSRD